MRKSLLFLEKIGHSRRVFFHSIYSYHSSVFSFAFYFALCLQQIYLVLWRPRIFSLREFYWQQQKHAARQFRFIQFILLNFHPKDAVPFFTHTLRLLLLLHSFLAYASKSFTTSGRWASSALCLVFKMPFNANSSWSSTAALVIKLL